MLCVCLIVRDEAETVGQTLTSIRETLGPSLREIVVHDTGSIDNTMGICKAHGAQVYQHPWVDFSTNRNAVLEQAEEEYAEPGDLLLMLDAGTILRGAVGKLRGKAKAYTVTVKLGTITYRRPQLFKAGAGWKYSGLVHEAADGPGTKGSTLLVVDYCLRDTARHERWHRDLELLVHDYSPRGRFYYAQTLELTGDPARAFFWYLHRAARSDGWIEETCMAYIRAISLAPSFVMARWCCTKALEADGTRGEAWLQFALYAASCATTPQEWQVVGIAASEALAHAPKADALFVDVDREWRARELCARSEFWAGRKAAARALWEGLLDDVPEYAKVQINENLRFCDG